MLFWAYRHLNKSDEQHLSTDLDDGNLQCSLQHSNVTATDQPNITMLRIKYQHAANAKVSTTSNPASRKPGKDVVGRRKTHVPVKLSPISVQPTQLSQTLAYSNCAAQF